MQIKHSSFWNQLYNFPTEHIGDTDICTFVRGAFVGVFFMIFITIVSVGGLVILLEPYIVGLMYLKTGHLMGFFFRGLGGLAVVSILAQLLVVGSLGLSYILKKVRGKIRSPRVTVPSVIAVRYRAFKEKTCILVERV